MTIDPRPAVVEHRLGGVRRIFPITGGKGGIGKSVVSTLLALALARRGLAVGLLDLDLTGPCDHLILGAVPQVPVEKFGVEPQNVGGVQFMSVSLFADNTPAPLRGEDVTGALLEMLAIIRWGELDALVIDMPPGLGDIALDAIRLIPRAEYLAVATASRLVLETVSRNLRLLGELKVNVAGIVENMRRSESTSVAEFAARHGVPMLGAVPWDERLESAIGDPEALARTAAAGALETVVESLFKA